MNTPPQMMDFLILLVLVLLTPLLTRHYLKGPRSSASLVVPVTLLGILWLFFGFVSEDLMEVISRFERMDSWTHQRAAESIVKGLEPSDFWDSLPTGNKAYQVWVSWLFSIGAFVPGARAVNTFAALWGGLALAGRIKYFFDPVGRRSALLYAVIFLPSTVFWCSNNLKEGLNYLGVCLMASSAFSGGSRSLLGPALIAGTVITAFMRPHICLAWLIPIGSVSLLTRGRRIYALIIVLALPFVFWHMQDLAQHDFSSVDSTATYLESHARSLRGMGGAAQIGESVPILSGLIAIFFRPFPWESGSALAAICAAEIWILTFTIIRAWTSLGRGQVRLAWKIPAVRISIFVLLIASVLFSYLPNDGLLARQRVQVVPALITLAVVPIGLRGLLRRARKTQNGQVAHDTYPFGQPLSAPPFVRGRVDGSPGSRPERVARRLT